MPKEAARLFLRVTGVRAERLQDMRLADYEREGVQLNFIEEADLARETYVRGGGPAPDYPDISLNEYTRQLIKTHAPESYTDLNDDDLSMMMAEWSFEGPDTIEGLIATLYTAAWAFSDLREHLKRREDAEEEKVGQKPLKNPFVNDPYAMVWEAFKRLYPDKECQVWWDMHQNDEHDEEYGFTHFPNDGSTPSVFVYAEHPVNIQVETLAHELAHVAVGPEHEHDDTWRAAFDAIFEEYNRMGDEMFGKPAEEGQEGGE